MERDMQTNPIELFDSRTKLRPIAELEPEVAALNDPIITENFIALKSATEASARDDADVEAAKDSIAVCINQMAAAEAYLKEHYPPMTQTQAAKAWIASQRGPQ
jgi:hypothetical protein